MFLSLQECEQRLLDAKDLIIEGDLEGVIEIYLEVYDSLKKLKRGEEATRVLADAGEAYERFGDIAKARAYYDRASREGVSNPEILRRCGDFFWRQGELDGATKLFRTVLLLPSSSTARAELYLRLGGVSQSQGDLKKAESYLERGLEAEAGHIGLQEALARLKRGEPPEKPALPERPKRRQPTHDEETLKQQLKCPKCKHNRILYIDQVADQTLGGRTFGQSQDPTPQRGSSLPWRLVRLPAPSDGFWGTGISVFNVGLVEAYVCRSCGFTEFYTKDVAKIPIDGEHVKELVGPEDSGPFR